MGSCCWIEGVFRMENNLRTVKSFRIFIAKGMVSDYWIVLAFSDIKLF